MNKNLVSELVKVANSLDNIGFSKEANSLDKIARKIVVSNTYRITNYKDDMDWYKTHFIASTNYSDENERARAKQRATDVYNAVMSDRTGIYSDAQKEAFKDQANAIRSLAYGNFDNEEANDLLVKYLALSGFTISNGVIDGNTDIKEFTDYWINNIQPKFSDNLSDPRYKNWLSKKFLLYKKSVLQAQKRKKEQEDSKKSWWQRTFGG